MRSSKAASDNYYENIETGQKVDNSKVQFDLHVLVTDAEVSVRCSFPGGQVQGSGQLDLIGPLLLKVMDEGAKAVKKGSK